MHEVSLIQSLFELVEDYGRQYRLRRITRVVIRIGELSCVSHDSLRFAFDAISRGTIAEGAEFVIETVKARCRCIECGGEFDADLREQTCPSCGKPVVCIAGKELDLQTIEGDQEDEVSGD